VIERRRARRTGCRRPFLGLHRHDARRRRRATWTPAALVHSLDSDRMRRSSSASRLLARRGIPCLRMPSRSWLAEALAPGNPGRLELISIEGGTPHRRDMCVGSGRVPDRAQQPPERDGDAADGSRQPLSPSGRLSPSVLISARFRSPIQAGARVLLASGRRAQRTAHRSRIAGGPRGRHRLDDPRHRLPRATARCPTRRWTHTIDVDDDHLQVGWCGPSQPLVAGEFDVGRRCRVISRSWSWKQDNCR